MVLPGPDFLEISYRPDLDVLVGRWMRKISAAEMCQGYEHLLEAAVQCGCRQWLLDARRRFNTDRDGARWMISTFLPQLGPRLGGRTHLAYLLAPVLLRDTEADAAFPPASFFDDKPYNADRFTDEREAIDWLQTARREAFSG